MDVEIELFEVPYAVWSDFDKVILLLLTSDGYVASDGSCGSIHFAKPFYVQDGDYDAANEAIVQFAEQHELNVTNWPYIPEE